MNAWQVVYILALLAALKAAISKSTTEGFTGVEIDPILIGLILLVSTVLWSFGFFNGMF